jgi:hypothetical protein
MGERRMRRKGHTGFFTRATAEEATAAPRSPATPHRRWNAAAMRYARYFVQQNATICW